MQFHKQKIEVNKYLFENMEDFEVWKKEEERKSRSLFVQSSATSLQGLNRKNVFIL